MIRLLRTLAVPGLVGLFFCFTLLFAPAQDSISPPAKYTKAISQLDHWIAQEVKEKDLPSLAVALVDDQDVIWTKGFGLENPATGKPATANTLYRVGSVSKPFTALLLMMLVEMGMIDLDTPVQKYLPDFHPKNPHAKKLTLRQMLSHRSGLVRESPVGNYFDDANPSLAATVKSLNQTTLVYPPETKTAYSNAAVATVGRIIEYQLKKPFAQVMQEKLLNRLGMMNSSFDPSPAQRKHIAHALMWSYHGREFPAPKWDLGMAPAGSLYSSANDMAKFLKFLFARGKGAKGRILQKKTLESMWKIQFDKGKTGFGLAFHISKFEGKRRIGHGGAVYGFSTQFSALPDDKLGVIVMSSRDVSNAVTRHIADVCLRHMLAVRQGKPLPAVEITRPLDRKTARKLAGRYKSGEKTFELIESNGKVYLLPDWIGVKMEVRRDKKGLLLDGWLGQGPRLKVKGKKIIYDKKEYKRVRVGKPKPIPEKWQGLIGEYGWDYNTLYILEKNGKLHALIEWVCLYPLKEVSRDVYKFPDFGLYQGDRLVFYRDKNGRATKVDAASVIFPRREVKGENGKTFTVKATQPVLKLRKIALKAAPPKEKGNFHKPNLVDLAKLDETLKFDIRYATTNNFLKTPFYTSARAFMQKPAAEALVRVHRKLKKKGYGLLIFDSYRPWHVTKMFWDATPKKFHGFVADPSKGSRHNRGCAVDLTLYDLKTGKPMQMVSGFDEFSDRSYPDYLGGTGLQRWHRDLLRKTMEEEGFSVYEAEWWHFDYRDWRSYPILNLTFEELEQKEKTP